MAAVARKRSIDEAIDYGARLLGYETLKVDQRHIITSFLEGNDIFACLPTGYGKSLCYFCLPVIFDQLQQHQSPWSVAIVVSPLQALMKDQVKSLERKGLRAISVLGNEDEETKEQIVYGEYNVIFTAPELLLSNKKWINVFQSPTLSERLIAVVIDEAHCVKKWLAFTNMYLLYLCKLYYRGSSFRKEFSKLGDLRGFFPSHLNYMALTATASAATRKTVIRLLGMHKPVVLSRSPSKSNMFYEVLEKDEEI